MFADCEGLTITPQPHAPRKRGQIFDNMNKREKEARASEAVAELRQIIKAGDTVYTSLRHVSASGMSRNIFYFVVVEGNKNSKGKAYIRNISHLVAYALGYRLNDKTGALVVGGCGMDMGYHVVYSLGSVLFGRGKETQALGYHTGRNGVSEAENDGGYLLEQRWL